MDFSSLQATLDFITTHGYFFIFLVMIIEGPVVTAAAAFAAALGHLNLPAVFILSFLGDLIGDVIYYSLGFWGRRKFIEKYGHRLGFTHPRIERLTHLIKTHPIKTLVLTKYIPVFSTTGLVSAGLAHFDFRRFILLDIFITLPNTIFFASLGFYSGLAFDSIFRSVRKVQYAALAIIILGLIVFFLYRSFFKYLSKNLNGKDLDNL